MNHTVLGVRRSLLVVILLLLLATSVWPTAPSGQPGPSVQVHPEVRATIQSQGVARVIVELRMPRGPHIPEGALPGPAAVAAQQQEIAAARARVLARLQGTAHRVVHEYSTVPFVALEVDDNALRVLEAAVFDVVRVVEDTIAVPQLAESGPLIQADQAWGRGFDGSSMTVAVLDTGIDSGHPFLSGKVVEEACFSSHGQCPNGQTFQTGPGAGAPCPAAGCNHGTHVAGIVAGNGETAGVTFSGVAKGATLMSVRVFDDFGGGALGALSSDVMKALEHVYSLRDRHRFASVNMSIVTTDKKSTGHCDNDVLKPAIDNLRSVGIAAVAAAGNAGYRDGMGPPACISSVISVAASGDDDLIAGFTNVAWFTSVIAPGVSIVSSVPGGGFASFGGTSMAAPHVAGAWAVLKQAAPTLSVTEILSTVQNTGLLVTDTRPDGSETRPRIRVANTLDWAGAPSLTAAITSPAEGAVINGTVTVEMSAGNPQGSPTHFLLKDHTTTLSSQSVANGSTATFVWDTATTKHGNPHPLSLTVTDAAGRTAMARIVVTVSTPTPPPDDSTPPTVSITSPSNGAWTGNSIGVKATATDNVGLASIKVYGNGGLILQTTCAGTSCMLDSRWVTGTLAPGAYETKAVATDASGNCAVSATVTIYKDAKTPVKASGAPSCSGGSPDPTPPTVTITSPTGGSTVSGTVTVSATASDNVGVTGVQFKLAGANLGAEDTSAPYAVAWNTATAANGTHTLTAVAKDAAGNTTTSAPVTVTVNNPKDDTTPPTVSITSPAGGSTVSGTVTVSASASDNVGVAGVQFKLDDATLGAEDPSAPYALSWDTKTAPNGSHTLTAVAKDAAGNTTTSAPVTVTVNNPPPDGGDPTPPTVVINNPSNGAWTGNSIGVKATASDNVGLASLKVYGDGGVILHVTCTGTSCTLEGRWITGSLAPGAYEMNAVATDTAGNCKVSATVTIYKDAKTPVKSSGATCAGP